MNNPTPETLHIATRGSALALAQANRVLAECRAAFPELAFALKIIKTTGDKLQTAALSKEGENLPKGLFTKELEVALLNGEADLAVHSLKDLPTELPDGLKLGAVGERADVRDVLLYRAAGASAGRGFAPGLQLKDLPVGATIATSSTRRKAQLLDRRPDLNVVEIRGNVGTRMQKLADQPELDGTILAAAGLGRLKFCIGADSHITGEGVPAGILASILDLEVMLPCVGQGAVGLEIRAQDPRAARVCAGLNHAATFSCVTAERAFLAAMGGGCQSPVAAYAHIVGADVHLRAVSYREIMVRRGQGIRPVADAAGLGRELAEKLCPPATA